MYAPNPFKITDLSKIIPFVRANSLGMIISSTDKFPLASPIPLILKQEAFKTKLIGHFAKANQQVAALNKDSNVLTVFSGAQGYISAYAKDPKALSILPTWDYQFVQATGKLKFIDENGLLEVLHELMEEHEMGEPKKMDLTNYPKKVFQKKLKAIIGFEIEVKEWQACFRLNQNRTKAERKNITSHLKENKALVQAINTHNI